MQANSSATMMDSHMPSNCHSNGKTNTATTWYNAVREKEMIADTKPLLSAVKNADAKIDTPAKTKEKEKIEKARKVMLSKSWS